MKLNNSVSGEIVGENLGESKAFGFEVNAKAFRLLSDNIYKDKIGSIVRELSSNAYDAHKAANNTKTPFFIHLPTVFEQYFSIRDYGIGLSREDIHRIYSTYFKSTKDNSNDMIGAFGLGSKTPFSYTDSFSIKSYFNGKLYIFAAMVDADGIPILTEMGLEDTVEHNGLEISFAMNNNYDYSQFYYACQNQLKYFDVKPNSNRPIGWPVINIVKDEGHFKVVDGNCGIVVKIGQIGYKVDEYELIKKIGGTSKDFFEIFSNIIIDAEIGNVEVTVSREMISYSNQTISFLKKFIEETTIKMFDKIKKEWDKEPNDFNRIKMLSVYKSPTKVFKLLDLKFNNADIEPSYNYFAVCLNRGGFVKKVLATHTTVTGIKFETVSNPIIILSPDSIYVSDENYKVTYYKWRLKALLQEYKNIYLFDMEHDGIEPYKTFLSNIPLTPLDTLPLPEDFKDRTRSNTKNPTCWVANGNEIFEKNLSSALKIYDDFEDKPGCEKVYVLRDYNDIFQSKLSPLLVDKLHDKKILNEIYCIRKKDFDEIKDLPDYIDLETYVDRELQKSKTGNIEDTIKLSKKYHLFEQIKTAIVFADWFKCAQISQSMWAQHVQNFRDKLYEKTDEIKKEYEDKISDLSPIELCFIEASAVDNDNKNYLSIVEKYVEKCNKIVAHEISALNLLRRHQFIISDKWSYLVSLVDEKINEKISSASVN